MSEELNTTGKGNDQNGAGEPKKGLSKAADHIQKGWQKFSTSSGGRWAIRITKGALIGLGLYKAYDYGKKSVKPEIIMVEPIQEQSEESSEEPVEESVEEPVEES